MVPFMGFRNLAHLNFALFAHAHDGLHLRLAQAKQAGRLNVFH
jgi:hypothetical protein